MKELITPKYCLNFSLKQGQKLQRNREDLRHVKVYLKFYPNIYKSFSFDDSKET